MYRNGLNEAAAAQLGIDYNCPPEDFFGKENKVYISNLNPGRRVLRPEPDFFKLGIMGAGAVASVSEEMSRFAADLLNEYNGNAPALFDGKSLYLINSELAKHGRAVGLINIYYLPSSPYRCNLSGGFNLNIIEEKDIPRKLYRYGGFDHALTYSGGVREPDVWGGATRSLFVETPSESRRKDALAVCAVNANSVMGIAGASRDSERFWQIGVDVVNEFRGLGIASELVITITKEIFKRGAVPYYGTWSGNIASQNVARKCGYYPAWTELVAFRC